MKRKLKLLSKEAIWREIRRLSLPEETKQKLQDLWHAARELCQSIVTWLHNRREFCTTIMLGIVAAYFVNSLPILGPILSTLTISLSVLYGIGRQFQADMDRHFSFIVQSA
jgi:hypothetical protein